ncbi:MAG TPA: choice-of-anchor tandem repeat GloVer-containing protein [Terriglobia bacterium]|nr:choice-of-anchor tandem repeat GloVer-containing protein [Terriglobia bacterium]
MNLSGWKANFVLCILCAATTIAAHAQTLTTLASFNGTDGSQPSVPLIQGLDGNLYGETFGGGIVSQLCSSTLSGAGCGTFFKITAAGALTTLYAFCSQANCADGFNPDGLALGTDGNFYGTTASGGSNRDGTVFRITAAGALTTLHSFKGTDGSAPTGTLVQGTDGNFYGATASGGTSSWGTVFKIATAGTLTTLHDFSLTGGGSPSGGLVQGSDGNFYGTTYYGGTGSACGPNACGTVFKMTPAGALTTLHSFDSTDGQSPVGKLVQGTDGNFYGTTGQGGLGDCNGLAGCGTVFKITSAGALTTLHSFDSADGGEPSGLTQATDGNFYGATEIGGSGNACGGNCGTAFKMTSAGTLTTLHDFDLTDGAGPASAPFEATSGTLYGTTQSGGSACGPAGCGTVFSLALGLGPFVETLPASGKTGTSVIILGNNLTGAASVTFNGTAATFSVVSSTEIKTTVPSGATTGKVKVKTPSRTLASNLNFRVIP